MSHRKETEQEAIARLRRQLDWLAEDVFCALTGEERSDQPGAEKSSAQTQPKPVSAWRRFLARMARARN